MSKVHSGCARAGLVLPALTSSVAEYTSGSGTLVRITVYQNPEPSAESRVIESVSILFPLLIGVVIGGPTVSAGERAIADGLFALHLDLTPPNPLQLVERPAFGTPLAELTGHFNHMTGDTQAAARGADAGVSFSPRRCPVGGPAQREPDVDLLGTGGRPKHCHDAGWWRGIERLITGCGRSCAILSPA